MYRHVVMFSSGAGSWAAARRVVEEHGADELALLFCNTDSTDTERSEHDGEDVDNYRFLREAAADVGGELAIVQDGRSVWDVFKDERIIGNSRVAPCSKRLKQIPARKWLFERCDPKETTVYVGIDWSESHRLSSITAAWDPFPVEAPLCKPPYLTKPQIVRALQLRGIEPPRLYEMGFPHANCGGFCVRGGHAHFKTLLQAMPERYAYHEAKEEEMRQYLNKDVSILKDRRDGQIKPFTMKELRERIESGREIDLFDVGGCGCFTGDDG